ncbi:MAG: hypothetical protein ACREYF_05080 [Gammaproteobacteria bacterium]
MDRSIFDAGGYVGRVGIIPGNGGSYVVFGWQLVLVKRGVRANLSVPRHRELSVGTRVDPQCRHDSR